MKTGDLLKGKKKGNGSLNNRLRMDSAQRAALTCEPDSVVDVFSEKPLLGNPVAVIMWDKFPSGHEMQQIAA